MQLTQTLPQTRKDKYLEKVEKELERIFPNKLEKNDAFLKTTTTKDIVIFRSRRFNKLVKGLTTKHLTGLLSQMKRTPVWS